MQATLRIIVRTRLTYPGENMLEQKRCIQGAAVLALWDVFPRDGSRAKRISLEFEESGASEFASYKDDRSNEGLVSAFLRDRHVAWMRWFENEIEARFKGMGGSLEIIADTLEVGFEDPKSFALAFINIASQCGDSDEEPCAILGEEKEHLRLFVEQLALRMGLQYPKMTACAAVRVIDRAIVRTLLAGSLIEAQTARLLFQCLHHV